VKEEQAGFPIATENVSAATEEGSTASDHPRELGSEENDTPTKENDLYGSGEVTTKPEKKIYAEEIKSVSTHSLEEISPSEQEIQAMEPRRLPDSLSVNKPGKRMIIANAEQIYIAEVTFQESSAPAKLIHRDLPLPEYTFERAPTFAKRRKSFGIGVYYAPTYNNTAVVGEPGIGELETGNHYLYSGNYGITAKYYFTDRLAFTSGIGSLKVKSWSKATTTFNYDGTNEHIMPDGKKENMSEVPMATPFGEVATEITYRFPGDEIIPDGEPMDAELETHQEISYFSVPLGMEYDLIPIKRMQWYGEGGVRLNWASGDATEFNSRILHYGHDMNVVREEMINHPDFSDFFLDFYVGTGISYPLSEYLLLQGSLRYTRNITKVNAQDGLSTRVQSLGMKFSLFYFF
jgi:hypothetical protein